MNRSLMAHILKEEYGWKVHVHNDKNRNSYQFYRRPDDERYSFVTPYFIVRDIEDIWLCTNEIRIEGRFGEMRVNIPYAHLDEFDILEKDEVEKI